MKKLFLLAITAVAAFFSANAQVEQSPLYFNEYRETGQEKMIWCDTTIKFDGNNNSAIGFATVPSVWTAMIYIDSTDVKFFEPGLELGAVQFFMRGQGSTTTPTWDSLTVLIYEGSSITGTTSTATITPGTLIYSKTYVGSTGLTVNAFTKHDIPSSPVQVFAGYDIDTIVNGDTTVVSIDTIYTGMFMVGSKTFDADSIHNDTLISITSDSAVFVQSAVIMMDTVAILSYLKFSDVYDTTTLYNTVNQKIIMKQNKSYAIGIRIFQSISSSQGGFPMGTDAGPCVRGKGAWVVSNSINAQLFALNSGLDYNWNIRACVRGKVFVPRHNLRLNSILAKPTRYELMPITQVNPDGYTFAMNLSNIGSQTATNVVAKVSVNSGAFVDSNIIASINSGISQTATLTNPFVPTSVGIYDVEGMVDMDSVDFNYFDNVRTGEFEITEDYYSRATTADFYTGDPGLYGNVYEIVNDAYVKSIFARYYNAGSIMSPGGKLFGIVYEADDTDVYDPIAYSDTVLISDTIENNGYYVIEMPFSSNVLLLSGKYFFAVQNEGGLLLQSGLNYYVNNTSFISQDDGDSWSSYAGRYPNVDVQLSETPPIDDTGIKGLNNLKVKMYPNPAQNRVVFVSAELINTVVIKDLTGRIVMEKHITNNTVETDISSLVSGVYFAEISSGTNKAVKKLVVRK